MVINMKRKRQIHFETIDEVEELDYFVSMRANTSNS